MDMRMPLMDGYEATRRIRALPGGGEVKIAALTASAFRENRDDILAAGCDEMVAKPLDEQQIFETMARLLGVAFDYERGGGRSGANGHGASTGIVAGVAARTGRRAARSRRVARYRACRALIERIAAIDADAAIICSALVNDFRFEELIRLLPTAGEGVDTPDQDFLCKQWTRAREDSKCIRRKAIAPSANARCIRWKAPAFPPYLLNSGLSPMQALLLVMVYSSV
jgi:hypothetical protein